MAKLLSILFLLVMSANVIAQDLNIPNNVYDNASEEISDRNAFKRERWFYEQRMYPNNFIPEDAYSKAIQQRDQMRQTYGFHNSSRSPWTSIGPSSGFYTGWGNISSRITTLAIDPVNPNIMYLGAAFGGVWKSTDAGSSWTPLTDNEISLSSGSIAIDPNNTNIIYYGTGEATYSGASYYGRGLLKSTDGGATWTHNQTGLPSLTYTSRLVIRPGHSDELLAAMGNSGLYKSTDAGFSWSQLLSGRCDDVLFTPSGDTAYAVGSGTGYTISTNGGASFNFTSAGFTPGTRNHLGICRDFPNVLYFAKYAGSSITVYKSTDAGFNYTQVSPGHDFSGSQAWYDFYMHVSPMNPDLAYVGAIDIWRTTNGGSSFQNISNAYNGGPVHPDQQNFAFHPTDVNKVYCTNDGGILSSNNQGNTWTNLNATLTLTQFYRIAADPLNADHIMGGTQDNGTQRTQGSLMWSLAFGGDGGEVCFHQQNNLHVLGETQNNGVRRSLNGGSSWGNATSGLTGSGAWVGPILSHPDSAGVFYTARQQVFKTTNTVATGWSPISTGTSGTIREMAISKSNPLVMYATAGSQIFRSTDGGYNFTNVTSGTPARTITSVSIHPDSSDVAIVTFSGFGTGKIYKTTNNGTSWENISGNIPDSPVNDGMIYYPGFSTNIYIVATDVGVFISNNWGLAYTELSDGLPNTVAMHLDYNAMSNKLRIGTHGRGVYETEILTSISNIGNSVPVTHALRQNYPNPFNPATKIQFDIPKASFVKLTVFDMLGREIDQLVNTNLTPGTYEVTYNIKNSNSGIYFYRLETNDFSETKKMIVVK